MLEWTETLIQYEWCPYKKRETEAETHRERKGYEDTQRRWDAMMEAEIACCCHKPRNTWGNQELRETRKDPH